MSAKIILGTIALLVAAGALGVCAYQSGYMVGSDLAERDNQAAEAG